MKKLYQIKVEYETFKIAENEEEALKEFYEGLQDVDDYIDDITTVSEIDEAQELLDEVKE